jgi:DNA polymerase-3 subunit gamma/tau
MSLVRMLAFRPAGGAGASTTPASGGARIAGSPGHSGSPSGAPIVRPSTAGPIDPVQWARVIGDLDLSGAARQLASNCALLEHRGNTLRLGIDPKISRTPGQVERLAQALAKYLALPLVKLEFAEGAPPVETPTQHGERRSAEALDAARRSLEDDPTVRDMKSRFGATLHPESVRPTEP